MQSRVNKILQIVAALALLSGLGSHLRFEETKIPLPLKGEAVSNPFYAAIKLAERLGYRPAGECEVLLLK